MQQRWLLVIILFCNVYIKNVYATADSLLESTIINKNINLLQKLYLHKRHNDKIFLILEKSSNNQIIAQVVVGRYCHINNLIDKNSYYSNNTDARHLGRDIANDVLEKISHKDFCDNVRIYDLAHLKRQ